MRDAAFGCAAWLMAMIVVVILVGGIGVAGFALDWWTTPFFGRLEARHQIYKGSNIIAQYDKFFNLCSTVQSDEVRYDNLKKTLDQTDDAYERNRLIQSMTSVLNLRGEVVAQYNNDSHKDYTDGQFKSSNLPYELNLDYKGGRTICAAN